MDRKRPWRSRFLTTTALVCIALAMLGCHQTKPKEFVGPGITILLDSTFEVASADGYSWALSSRDYWFLLIKENKDALIPYGIGTQEEYFEAILPEVDYALETFFVLVNDKPLLYAYHIGPFQDENYGIMYMVLEGNEDYYFMQFLCYAYELDRSKPKLKAWAQTIRVE